KPILLQTSILNQCLPIHITKIFYDYGIITTKKDQRTKKKFLERISKRLTKFLKKLNLQLKRMK
ncbi:hypothetical protein J4231_01200, partial [Candidatus Woesearchaeota archaeon]|nr:hypothetical protein [Candidatus Woesearchaeota archaeon]